jgi:hypothetical protein
VRASPAIDMTMPAGVAEGAEKLLASAEQDGGIMLAELSQAELCALRAETASLVCEQTSRWWVRLGPAGRERLGRMALELMASRGFLRLAPGASAADIYERNELTNEDLGPELAVILAARTSPRPLVTCRVPGMDDLNWCHPRFFGITSPEHRLRALVCEVLTEHPAGLHGRPTLGTILRYTLMTPERTAKMITSWAAVIPQGRRRNGPPTVTVIAHGGQAALDQERFEIRPEHGTFTVTRTVPQVDPAVILNETETITELASALTRMAR